jgi:hypothetical protein
LASEELLNLANPFLFNKTDKLKIVAILGASLEKKYVGGP